MKAWFKAANVRAIKTIAQALVAAIGSAAVLESVDWRVALSTAALAGVLSLLTSIAGLPEVKDADNPNTRPDSIAHTEMDTDFAKTDDDLKKLGGAE